MSTVRLLLLGSFALAGCAETCPPPQAELDGKRFEVMSRVLTLDQPPAPEWPSESMPFNGLHTWTIDWATNDYESAVVVTIDDQVFEGAVGIFDDVECGNFSLGFNGSYFGADGAEHLFGTTGRYVVWPDGLDGFLEFQSTWQGLDEVQGMASGTAQITIASAAPDSTP